jgi:DNA-nicking Smr family endonuclease
MIDLHGLYVDEALQYAKEAFQSAILRNDKVVRFIVGKGLHAKDGKVKIRPALEKLCKERGLIHYLDPKNAGILVVEY